MAVRLRLSRVESTAASRRRADVHDANEAMHRRALHLHHNAATLHDRLDVIADAEDDEARSRVAP
jgi:hypothetical protein